MYKTTFLKNHYSAGYDYGKYLFDNNVNPFTFIHTSDEMSNFAKHCIPLYKQYFPEILDEIQGMADGLQLDSNLISDFLFTMYSHTVSNHCSCFAFSYNGNTFLGRNSDLSPIIADVCESTYYNLDNAFSFIGNTSAWMQMEDGVNEHGLSVGLTLVFPYKIAHGLNAGMITRLLLEKCKSTKQAIDIIKSLPISSSQTLTIADKSGDIATIECNCEKTIIVNPSSEPRFVFSTNHFNTEEMLAYRKPNWEEFVQSYERQRTFESAFSSNDNFTLDFAMNLLSGKLGFICQYDCENKGIDTVWSSIYALNENKAFISDGNPKNTEYTIDTRVSF